MPCQQFRAIVASAADAAIHKMRAGMGQPIDFYYTATDGTRDGAIHPVTPGDPIPAGSIRMCKEALTGDRPYSTFGDWIAQRAARLPLLAPEPPTQKPARTFQHRAMR